MITSNIYRGNVFWRFYSFRIIPTNMTLDHFLNRRRAIPRFTDPMAKISSACINWTIISTIIYVIKMLKSQFFGQLFTFFFLVLIMVKWNKSPNCFATCSNKCLGICDNSIPLSVLTIQRMSFGINSV